VVVGVDGFSFNHIRAVAGRGLMPNVSGLLAEGAAAPLASSTPWQTPVGWTTYSTGVNPGRHGIFGWWTPDPESGELRPTSGSRVERARVWEMLSAAGLRVGVLNVPMTYPARPLNGFLVAGLDSPSFTPEMDDLFAWPRTLLSELAAAGVEYKLMPELPPDEPLPVIARRWADVELARTRAAEVLTERFQPDFLQVNIFLTDYLAHRAPVGDPSFLLGYAVADEIIGRLRALAGTDARFIVMSDHGSTPIERFVMVHNLLRELGVLRFHDELAEEQVPGVVGLPASSAKVRDLIATMRRKGPDYRAALYRDLRQSRPGANVGFSTIDWDRTHAYCVSDYGQIRVNRVRGRGAVESPGAAKRVLDLVRDALSGLADNGQTLVDRVIDGEQLYHGPHRAAGPDLTPVLKEHSTYFCQVYSFYGAGEQRVIAPVAEVVDPAGTGSVGDHLPHGVLMMSGPRAPAGAWLPTASILDVAPTILHELGVDPLPEQEGVVLGDFTGGSRQAERPSVAPSPPAGDHGLRERLRDLGYRV
jgi:predicted AlkP superfamily phosphohydrolase/phosphomutase